jgi:hypothetical protein
VRGVPALRGFSCGVLPAAVSRAPPLILQHTGAGPAAQQHRQRASRSLPQKRKHPGNPGRPVAAVAAPRRESRVVVLAVPPRRPCQPRRMPAPRSSSGLFSCAEGEGRRKELCQTLDEDVRRRSVSQPGNPRLRSCFGAQRPPSRVQALRLAVILPK